MTKANALKNGITAETWIRNCRDRRVKGKKPVKNAKGQETWTETDGAGLYLEVTLTKPEGQDRYVWRHQYKRPASSPKVGQGNRLTYGEWPAISVEKARELATANRTLLEQNIDPAEARDAKKAQAAQAVAIANENAERVAEGKAVVSSFRWWAEQVETAMTNTWDPATLADFHRQTQTGRVLKAFGNMDIRDVVANDGALVKSLFD